MRRRAVAMSSAALLGLALSASSAVAQAPRTSSARLEGSFALYATVTVAQDVPGERAGTHFLTTWRFTAPCPAGACSTVTLARPRGPAKDLLVLSRREPDSYVGTGSFYAPARCGKRTYPQGILVPYTIAVRVIAAALNPAGTVAATRLSVGYTDSKRINLTPCVAALGHDAATYHGHLVA